MYHILCRVRDNCATAEDLVTLKDLADNIHSKTICFFGASAAMPVQSFLLKFKGEFLARIEAASKGLPAGSHVSPASLSVVGA